jgi:hypothetical protein
MAATQTAYVPDLLLLEMGLQGVVQFRLSACAQTSAAVAHEDLLPLVFLFQKVVKAHRTKRNGVPKKVIRTQLPDGLVLLGRASLVGSIDHAFKDVFFDTFAKREGAEIFRHAVGERYKTTFVCGAYQEIVIVGKTSLLLRQ